MQGYVKWYDRLSGDGMIKCIDNELNYYFNVWSFSETKYKVTGICKKTGRKKTIKTRLFPGLFLQHKILNDPVLSKIKYDTPVRFDQFEDHAWAIHVKIDNSLKRKIWETKMLWCLDSMLLGDQKESIRMFNKLLQDIPN
jgi:hypothetical protein